VAPVAERQSLLGQVRDLLNTAARAYAGSPHATSLAAVVDRMDEPLRVAIAGKVKAGKSTLLNALVGEELAPTDAGECTKIVTWYRDGITYRVTLHPKDGSEPRQVPFSRDAGAIDVDLQDTPADFIDRLVVEWPSSSLRSITLIDTPGIASLSVDVSARAHAFLAPGEDQVTPADAVLYLMRHLHTTDISFLETFHDQEFAQATPVNAIAVLSRADEVGVGRLDSMASAARIATRYKADAKVRRLCQTVVPVAGLLAQSGSTLREAEFKAMSQIATAPKDDAERLFLSADRFVQAPTSIALTSMEREHLLDRFGLFGVRLAAALIRQGTVTTSTQLANELVLRSGLIELKQLLLSQFAARRDVLKARSALLALEAVLHESPIAASPQLASELERVTAGAHEFAEVRLLNALRSGAVKAKPAEVEEMERLLGSSGTASWTRLGLEPTASTGELRTALSNAIGRWQRRAENPLSSREIADASRVLIRTCEGLLVDLN
jgi:predicted GTPase